MEYADKSLKLYDKLTRIDKNSGKTIPKLLRYLGKIDSVEQYDKYIKTIKVSLFDFGFEVLFIRALLIYFVLICCLPFIRYYGLFQMPAIFFAAEGLSVLIYLILDFKKDLWRKEK